MHPFPPMHAPPNLQALTHGKKNLNGYNCNKNPVIFITILLSRYNGRKSENINLSSRWENTVLVYWQLKKLYIMFVIMNACYAGSLDAKEWCRITMFVKVYLKLKWHVCPLFKLWKRFLNCTNFFFFFFHLTSGWEVCWNLQCWCCTIFVLLYIC